MRCLASILVQGERAKDSLRVHVFRAMGRHFCTNYTCRYKNELLSPIIPADTIMYLAKFYLCSVSVVILSYMFFADTPTITVIVFLNIHTVLHAVMYGV